MSAGTAERNTSHQKEKLSFLYIWPLQAPLWVFSLHLAAFFPTLSVQSSGQVTSKGRHGKEFHEIPERCTWGLSGDPSTVSFILIRNGFSERVAIKSSHSLGRCARSHKTWTDNQLQQVSWSDESKKKCESFGSNCWQYVQKVDKRGPRVSHGLSI